MVRQNGKIYETARLFFLFLILDLVFGREKVIRYFTPYKIFTAFLFDGLSLKSEWE